NRRRGRLLQEPRFDCRHKFCRSGPCPRSYNGPINNIGPVIAGMHRYEKAMPANGSHAPCLLAYVSRMAIIAGVAGSYRSQDSIAGTKSVGAGHARDHTMVQSTTLDRSSLACIDMKRP